ncbi:MAG: ATP-binding cassette domain-containing protein [Betaproteobacteria bacterium]|nr:ATP-binding cassette domain-containing protein [Betaproteobacteria bacterium]
MPFITLRHISLAYGHHALLEGVNLVVEEGQRLGLIGRNGGGKSSLLKIILGTVNQDEGERWVQPGLKMGYVAQETEFNGAQTVEEILTQASLLHHEWAPTHQIATMMAEMGFIGTETVAALSGGWKKKLSLACALINQPELLILDEPTNHLDIDAIQWLEHLLNTFKGSVIFVTHDRAFLDHVATDIIELDRGKLAHYGQRFATYQIRKQEMLAVEQMHQEKFDKLLAQEEVWIRKGIEARRTRNEGRVRRLEALRVERSRRRDQLGSVRLNLQTGDRSGELVVELDNVSIAYQERTLVSGLSTRIQRGDKIGIIGPNGSGKTTLLRTLLGELKPDQGQVKLGTKIQVAYFDQLREQLDPEATLIDTISPGSDFIEINGIRKHRVSYLEDFLFPPERTRAKVKSLSGGERNRLLLARLFAKPANVLVLDEPTNDLDMDTLEVLEELLSDYNGTLFLVSHDRAFLDNVVTQVMVLDGQGRVTENAGGYSDWLIYLNRTQVSTIASTSITQEAKKPASQDNKERVKTRPEKMTNREQQELESIPNKIDLLEQEQNAINEQLSDPSLYTSQAEKVSQLQNRLSQLQEEIETLLERWEVLEQKVLRLKS